MVDEENLVDPILIPNEGTSPGSSNEILSTTETANDFPILSGFNFDTIATKPIMSLVVELMPVEYFPRTRANPEVSSDKMSDMENLKVAFSPSTTQYRCLSVK